MSANLLPGAMQPMAGTGQHIALSTSVSKLTVPNGAVFALIQASGANALWTDDGSTPSATNGFAMVSGDDPQGFGGAQLAALKFVQGAAGAVVQVAYYD